MCDDWLSIMADQSTSDQTDSKRSRVPLTHPDFRYHRSDNPYAAKIQEIPRLAVADNEAENHRGRWHEVFQHQNTTSRRPLHVEIGCNKGHVIREWAHQNPQNNYIGIDWKFKIIYQAAEKAIAKNIQNLFFIRAYAERIEYIFGKEEIDNLYLYFPDPWPKKAHWKNRYITPERLTALAQVVRKGGIFHIKTDHFGYFQWMEEALHNLNSKDPTWEIVERTTDLHAGHPNPTALQIPEVTLFERLFIKDGIKINSLKPKRI